jgi:putative ABC transport system permease protein
MSEVLRLLRELWSERARVGLVALGVLWGTLSLGVLLAFGTSMAEATSTTADNFGKGLLRIRGNATTRSFAGMPAGRSIGLLAEDAAALARIPGVRGSCYEFSLGSGMVAEYEGARRSVSVAGVSESFGELRNHTALPGGRFLHTRDHQERRKVCFLGNRLAGRLFGDTDPIGASLLLAGQPFQVIGVGPPRITPSNYNGEDRDKLTMPASTFRELMGWRFASYAWVGLEAGADKSNVLAEVRRRLGARLRFDPSDADALDIQDYLEIRAMLEGIIAGNRIFTLIVGIMGLLVAVVGVTNVMLALVEERTRELGVQLAIGAPPRLLAIERVIEGVLVTLAGGLAGLLICAGLLAILASFPLPIEVQAYLGQPQLHVGLSMAVLAALIFFGALAGWLPARRAIQLQPAEVLRDE